MEKNKQNETSFRSRAMKITVKAVVLNKKNEVLLLKRSKNKKFSPGKFDLPGGHIEENESLFDSILREIEEETGLKAIFGDIINVVEFPKDSQMFKDEKRGIRCVCYVSSEEVNLSDEHDEFFWFSFEEALEKISEKDGFENEKRNTIIKAQKYLEMKNSLEGWKRCRADFENFKKRQAEEKRDFLAFSNVNLIMEILPVLDNFEASVEHIPEDQKENGWVVGIMYIKKQLQKIMEDNGLEEIMVKSGDKFDPQIHEAVGDNNQETKDKKEVGDRIERIVQKGYKIGARVIRPARVVVE